MDHRQQKPIILRKSVPEFYNVLSTLVGQRISNAAPNLVQTRGSISIQPIEPCSNGSRIELSIPTNHSSNGHQNDVSSINGTGNEIQPGPSPILESGRRAQALSSFVLDTGNRSHADTPTTNNIDELGASYNNSIRPESINEIQNTSTVNQLGHSSNGPTPSGTTEISHSSVHKKPFFKSRKFTFLTFIVVFLIIIGAVIILAYFSHVQNGFNIPTFAKPFAWKFGPTAILTIVIAFWTQVDLDLKLEAPWIEMKKSQVSAQKSVLLDYISPLLPLTLVSAVKNRHWSVAASILVCIFIKLATAFSTGLFAIESTNMMVRTNNISLQLVSGASRPDPLLEYYATTVYQIPYLPGISNTAAFQVFSTENDFPPYSTVTAEVLAFFADLDCEEASVTSSFSPGWHPNIPSSYERGNSTNDTAWHISFQSASCSGNLSSFSVQEVLSREPVYFGISTAVYCSQFDESPNYPGQNNALVFSMTKAARNGTEATTLWNSTILCRSTYAIAKANLHMNTIDPTNITLSSPVAQTGSYFPEYAPSNLTQDIDALIGRQYMTIAMDSQANFSFSKGFALMAGDRNITSLEDFHNTSILEKSAKNIFRGLSAEIIGQWMSFPQHLVTNGTYQSQQQRLHVQITAVWEMVICLSLGVAAILVLLPKSSQEDDYPRFPCEYITSASKDETFRELLLNSGHVTDMELKELLSSSQFTLFSDQSKVYLQATTSAEASSISKTVPKPSRNIAKWWVPMSTQRWFAILCIIIPLSEICVLEILQRKSDALVGICDSNVSALISHGLISLIPAILMLSTATLYRSAEWAFTVLAPYFEAKKRPWANRYLKTGSTDLAPVAVIKHLLRGQFAVSIMMISTILGSLLTIFVSGLLEVKQVTRPYPAVIKTMDQFNPSWYYNFSTGIKGHVYEDCVMIHMFNASYSYGVFKEFAYPTIEIVSEKNNTRSNSSHLDISLSVTRPSLDCYVVPPEQLSWGPVMVYDEIWNLSNRIPARELNVTGNLPDRCMFSKGAWQNSSQFFARSRLHLTGWQATTIMLSPSPDDFTDSAFPMDPDPYPFYDYPPYCPSSAIVVGNVENNTNTADIIVAVCSQIQTEVPALLRFRYPEISLDTAKSPQLDEENIRIISGYQYDHRQMFQSVSFFDSIPELIGKSATDMIQCGRNCIMNAIQATYRHYMAITFNDVLRVTSSELDSTNNFPNVTHIGTNFTGHIYDPNALRVVQNKTPKIILQCLLASMVGFFVIAYMTVELRTVLLHNPCSIAGTMSLLLGSEFENRVNSSQKNEESAIDLNDLKVKLAWWENEGQERYGIDLSE